MKPLPLFVLIWLGGAAWGQNADSHFAADRTVRDGPVSKLTGHVQVRTGPYRLQADQGSVNADTEEIDLRGHVRITLPARPDRQ